MLRKINILCIVLLGLLLSGCASNVRMIAMTYDGVAMKPYSRQEGYAVKHKEKESRLKQITLSAVGDIMVHRTQLVRAYDGTAFDFWPSFKYIEPLISTADLALANLETTFAGVNGQRRIRPEKFFNGYSGYPCFNTPDQLASSIKEAGFDLVATANNHSLDSEESGVIRTIEVLDDIGLRHVGTYKTKEAANEVHIEEVEGITFAVINYTYGLNGFSLTEEDYYLVNNLDMYQDKYIDEMIKKVEAANQSEVDFVVIMLHYGNEYVSYPDKYYQKPIVDQLFEAGADIILGGHPHVLQPIEIRDLVRADGTNEKGVVMYSLGNFLSSQRNVYGHGADKDIGVIFEVVIEQVDHHKPIITEVAFSPTYTYWSDDMITVVPTLDIPDELILSSTDKERIEYANTAVVEHLSYYLENSVELEGVYYRYKIVD